ncbi:MAG: glycosyltransferase family 2 protein, partial [Myxococcota bacterium]
MLLGKQVAVVVPAHNEERLLGPTLARIPEYVDLVVVVDDASSDRTGAVAQAAGTRVRLVRHETQHGVGKAVATGYRAAFRARADVAVVMAGDNQMDPEDLPRILRPILEGHADYCQGDRLSFPHARKLMPLPRWLGNHGLTLATRFVVGLPIRDSQ